MPQNTPEPTDGQDCGPDGTQSALVRLAQLKRALQKRLHRKPSEYERTMLEHAALLQLRSEIAARNPSTPSNDIVRLAGCARRAMSDFESLCRPEPAPLPSSLAEMGL
jgi:hypothetical protein